MNSVQLHSTKSKDFLEAVNAEDIEITMHNRPWALASINNTNKVKNKMRYCDFIRGSKKHFNKMLALGDIEIVCLYGVGVYESFYLSKL